MSLNLVNIHGEIEGDYEIIKTFPKSVTNGDMVRVVFGNVAYFVFKDKMEFDNGFMEWWNAPYKPQESGE